MTIASPEAISNALSIIERQPRPTSFELLPSSETDEPNCWVVKWNGPSPLLLVYLRCGNNYALLGTGPRVWVSLDEIQIFTPAVQQPEPVGTGGNYCIDLNPLDGLTEALHAALAVPLNI